MSSDTVTNRIEIAMDRNYNEKAFREQIRRQNPDMPAVPDDYPQYVAGPYVYSEQHFFKIQYPECTVNELRAFLIANKADVAYEQGKIADAQKMCFHALTFNACDVDAYTGLTRQLIKVIEDDYTLIN